jgi:integrase
MVAAHHDLCPKECPARARYRGLADWPPPARYYRRHVLTALTDWSLIGYYVTRQARKRRNATSSVRSNAEDTAPPSKGRQGNEVYRVREHLTEAEIEKLLTALKQNRYGHRDWLIGLMIYRRGLRASEACDLHWDDIDLTKRTIIVRRLKSSIDSSHYLERVEHRALGELWRYRITSSSMSVANPWAQWALAA